ncbi:MAG: accessory factor UbiK family protein [Pseudomonadota bacterium]|jgi:BMFP domain-containing protein YqiC|nr:accessory factor UbiK family protein [Gammaproteobacteria bacterium]MBU1733036.1 accessory factor UbiK family protein [Gammaproteobacteria bacterium]MBU1892084.1 accessory factor UbiK family protein [Gammaproteobacteria bacterium]
MLNHKVLDEINAKISQVLAASPAGDVEKNLRASLQGLFSRLDLVTREEFEVQQAVLVRTREKLDRLEVQVAAMEKQFRTESVKQQ